MSTNEQDTVTARIEEINKIYQLFSIVLMLNEAQKTNDEAMFAAGLRFHWDKFEKVIPEEVKRTSVEYNLFDLFISSKGKMSQLKDEMDNSILKLFGERLHKMITDKAYERLEFGKKIFAVSKVVREEMKKEEV